MRTTAGNSATATAWDAWDAATAPPMSYLVVPHGTREWTPSWCEGLVMEDLGFAEATEGRVDAVNLRTEGASGEGDAWPGRGEDLCFVLVLEGQLELKATATGEHIVLRRYDSITMPHGWRPDRFWFTHDLAAVVLRAPTIPSARLAELKRPVISQHGAHSYTPTGGAGRSYFEYRDLGFAELTDGLVGLNITRALDVSAPGGTGKHWHDMCQWNLTLSGWYDITVEGNPSKRLVAGDSTFTPTEAVHHVTAYSRDFANLNLVMPAAFSTTDV